MRTFRAVVDRGSFTAAARSLGYTQSAVSQQVAALEASLGVVLFQRRPFAVTAAGRRLAEHASNILLRVDVATSEAKAIDRGMITTLAATPVAAATVEVARLLALAQRADGARSAVLLTGMTDEVVAAVADGRCMAGVVDGIVGRSDPLGLADPGLLSALLLGVGAMAVVLPADHPFADVRSIAWRSVADAHWIDAPQLMPHLGPGAAQLLERRRSRVRYEGTDPSVLGSLVAAGHGLALMPLASAGLSPTTSASIRVVPLTEPALVHRVEVVVLRKHAEVWEHLVSAVRPA